jgi:group I intron endonuclease
MRHIYIFKNTIDNKVYVGQSKHPNKRKLEHLSSARDGVTGKLYYAIRKHGEDNFIFEVIEECEDEISNQREAFWISHYDSFQNGYNLTTGGDHYQLADEVKNKIGSAFRGKTLSDDHKQKLREANLGKKPPPHSEETLQRMSNSMIGKNTGPKSEEHKRKLSLAHKGKTLSEEHKEKLRNKPITDETRQKISNAGKGRIVTEETRKKQSETLMGIKRGPQTEEVKERRAQKLRGRKQTEEAKQKMRDAWSRKREERKLLTTDSK